SRRSATHPRCRSSRAERSSRRSRTRGSASSRTWATSPGTPSEPDRDDAETERGVQSLHPPRVFGLSSLSARERLGRARSPERLEARRDAPSPLGQEHREELELEGERLLARGAERARHVLELLQGDRGRERGRGGRGRALLAPLGALAKAIGRAALAQERDEL